MKNRIITVSRQFGSGGRVIGEEVAKKLGIPCYDQELIKMFAGESGFSEDYIKESSEHAMHGNLLSSIFSDRVYDTPITQDVLWEAQRKVILELAQKGSCVIVGRCADYILRDEAELFKVFGDSTRMRILFVLFEAEVCVCDLAEALSMTVSAISHQLKILKQSKLVKSEKKGRSVFYSLADEHVRSIVEQGMEHILE